MRPVTLLVATAGVAMLLGGGVALAATLEGTDGPDTLVSGCR
jgi:hypothetical protein